MNTKKVLKKKKNIFIKIVNDGDKRSQYKDREN